MQNKEELSKERNRIIQTVHCNARRDLQGRGGICLPRRGRPGDAADALHGGGNGAFGKPAEGRPARGLPGKLSLRGGDAGGKPLYRGTVGDAV